MFVKTLGWLVFVMVQAIMFAAAVVGLFLLIPFCLFKAWKLEGHSIKDGRPIDQWTWRWLRPIFNNPEDGVSGQTALVWNDEGLLRPYLPDAGPRWRAYRWSAIRNSCDNLKYVFSWQNGPYKEITLRFGWKPENGVKVPIIGRM